MSWASGFLSNALESAKQAGGQALAAAQKAAENPCTGGEGKRRHSGMGNLYSNKTCLLADSFSIVNCVNRQASFRILKRNDNKVTR